MLIKIRLITLADNPFLNFWQQKKDTKIAFSILCKLLLSFTLFSFRLPCLFYFSRIFIDYYLIIGLSIIIGGDSGGCGFGFGFAALELFHLYHLGCCSPIVHMKLFR